jgi:hypothetical protein
MIGENAVNLIVSLAEINNIMQDERDRLESYMRGTVAAKASDMLTKAFNKEIDLESCMEVVEMRAKSEEITKEMRFIANLSEKLADLTRALSGDQEEGA